MKRVLAFVVLVAALGSGSIHCLASAAGSPYSRATLGQTLELIAGAKREVWLLAPTLRRLEVYRALRARAEAGVTLRLLVASQAGYTGYERHLARVHNVDARWLPDRLDGAVLVVDDRAMVLGPVLSGLPAPGDSVLVSRPELVPATAYTVKQLFARGRPVR